MSGVGAPTLNYSVRNQGWKNTVKE